MKWLNEIIIGLFELAEAEGRLLRRRALQTLGTALLMILALLLVFVSSGLMLSAFYHVLLEWLLTPASALFLTGLLALIFAGVTIWGALKLHHRL
ncbi:MAG: hypothetical protein R3E89_18455 [Thiolinea sp.]